jgi:hypothetical protein
VIIPVRNEITNIARVLEMVEAQSRRPDEVVVADGLSDDGTREHLTEAARTRPWLTVVDNEHRIVPGGLNAALAAATGDLVVRMDAHAHYPADYIEVMERFLAEHPDVSAVGGAMITEGRSPWGRAIAAVLARPIGMGGAKHRVTTEAGPVEHVFSGCYRRSALMGIGGWDLRFPANEDFEADTRLREQGGQVWLTPRVRPIWFTRDTLRGLAQQMWRYGGGKALTLHDHPDSLRARQLVPVVLLTGLTGVTVLNPRLGLKTWAAYLLASGAAGARVAQQDGASPAKGALVPATVHLSWGAGCTVGLVRHKLSRRVGRPMTLLTAEPIAS